MTPFEAGHVLAQAAYHLGIEEIPDYYLQEGRLREILLLEDYVPLKNVSTNLFTTCEPTAGFSLALAIISEIFCSPSTVCWEEPDSIVCRFYLTIFMNLEKVRLHWLRN